MFNVGQRRKTNSNTSFSGKAEKLDRRPQIRLPNARPSFHALGWSKACSHLTRMQRVTCASSGRRVVPPSHEKGQHTGAPYEHTTGMRRCAQRAPGK